MLLNCWNAEHAQARTHRSAQHANTKAGKRHTHRRHPLRRSSLVNGTEESAAE